MEKLQKTTDGSAYTGGAGTATITITYAIAGGEAGASNYGYSSIDAGSDIQDIQVQLASVESKIS